MTPLAQRLLDVDIAALSLAHLLGRSERGNKLREALKALRLAAAEAAIADIGANPQQMPPKDAVKRVVELALAAGIDFPQIAGWVNSVSEHRYGAEQ